MLDVNVIRSNPDMIRTMIRNRNRDETILDRFLEADSEWRSLTDENNRLRKTRNDVSLEISKMPKGEEKDAKIAEMRAVGDKIKANDTRMTELEEMIAAVKPAEILTFIDTYRKVYDFDEIIPVSAKVGTGVDDVVETIFSYLPYGPMYYDPDTLTDQPERQIAAELIREKALRALKDEVPHGIAVAIDRMKTRKDRNMVDIEATIVCERDSHKGIIIGKQGSMLKKIGSQARPEIEEMLGKKVNLKIWVKVRKDWRDSDIMVKNFGYSKKEL